MSTPADWHPDPTGRHEHRYWDGDKWTDHVADAGVSALDPVDGSGAPSADDTSSEPRTSEGSGGSAPQDSSYTPPIEPTSGAAGASAAGWSQPASPFQAGSTQQPPSYGGQPGAFPSAPGVDGTAPQGSNPMAITGMVLGIASIVLSWLGAFGTVAGIIMVLIGIAAIVISIIGKRRATRGLSGNGMAITGIVTGIIGLIASAVFLGGGMFYRAYQVEFNELFTCLEETGDQQACQEQFERRLMQQ